jgi:hypothetical protein
VGLALLARFDATGSGEDLDEAIDAGRQAVAAIAESWHRLGPHHMPLEAQ